MVAEENPFVRFKNFIDGNVSRGVDAVFGPSGLLSPPASTTTTTTSSPKDPGITYTGNTHPPPQEPQSPSVSTSKPRMTDKSSTPVSEARGYEQHCISPPSSTTTSTAAVTTATPTATMDDVHTWSVQSPYSPLNLQHLPQPTPRDAPQGWNHSFTFRDAFEDLLVAGSGQPLSSMRVLIRKKARETLPFWERERGLHVAHWVGGLAALGLWDAYFNLGPRRTGRDADMDRFPRQMYFRQGRTLPEEPRGLTGRDGGWGACEDRGGLRKGPFDGMGIWDAAWRIGQNLDRQWGMDADVEDELYRPNTSALSTTNRNSGSGSGSGSGKDTAGGLLKPAVPEVTTTVYADGSKYVATTERREEDGKLRVTTTAQHFDASGNLISESRETSSTRTWSGKIPGAEASFSWSWNSDCKDESCGESDGKHDDGTRRQDRKDGKSGWFWKW
ncbi:hypothetical protein F5B17DRAFT_418737 [Nemania serpens]|nr:hypothetical protein F5B17DRAFT_418737 [Nemania serpens]